LIVSIDPIGIYPWIHRRLCPSMLRSLSDSMPKRLEMVIVTKGDMTKYWLKLFFAQLREKIRTACFFLYFIMCFFFELVDARPFFEYMHFPKVNQIFFSCLQYEEILVLQHFCKIVSLATGIFFGFFCRSNFLRLGQKFVTKIIQPNSNFVHFNSI
jgi:hypothetical protein